MRLKVLKELWKTIIQKMMNPEQYENLIALLKQALDFYGDKENYLFYKDKDAPIALDEGSQARFALEKIKEMTEATDKLESEFVKEIIDGMKDDDSPENIMKIIETYKKIGSGN